MLIACHAGPTQATPHSQHHGYGVDLPILPFAYMAEPAFGLVAQGAKRVVLGNQVSDYAAASI